MKYTREDVIKWPDDLRLSKAIGEICYGGEKPEQALVDAQDDKFRLVLDHINPMGCPFIVHNEKGTYGFPYIILKKKKKIVPFDFSRKEDRDALMGKRIYNDNIDQVITGFISGEDGSWTEWNTTYNGEEILRCGFVFADGPNEGKPVGKEVEV